jgi:caffeoyl-CoA O-methyltransferase
MADIESRAGRHYGTPPILAWADALHVPHDEALAQAYACDRVGIEPIQVGMSEGKLLGMLLRLAGARRVVELGTLAGYSTIHLARALPADGHLWTIEAEPRHAAVARQNLAAAGVAAKVTVVEGKALSVLADLERHGPFCAVFLDADKGNYDQYGRWSAAHLRPGGLLLADNAFFFGDLLDQDKPAAAAMRRIHEESRADFDTVCIPTPDGLLVGIRR